jgi:cell surface protein SprA
MVLTGITGLAVTITAIRETSAPAQLFSIPAAYYLAPDSTDKDSTKTDQSTGVSDYFGTDTSAFDLDLPAGIQPTLEYDPETGDYLYMEKVGDAYYQNPQYISFEDFLEAEMEKSISDYWVERSTAQSILDGTGTIPQIYTGSELLDRLFGGSNVDIRPQGNIDLTFGGSFQNVGNPILTEDQRKQGGFDFNMDINANMLGQVGEKMKLTFNYNTSATFDFENQVKLEYTGYEDEIIQKIEAGNVSLPLTTSLIPGTQSLWGIKTELQFGRLTMTNILSQQRSQSQSIQIEGGAQKREFEVFANQYDENRHFFLSHYMRNNYEPWLSTLPFVNSPVNITRMEVWVTNTTGATQNTRDIVAFSDLGETDSAYWTPDNGGTTNVLSADDLPNNYANDLYGKLLADPNVRNLNTVVSALSDPAGQYNMQPVRDFEKVRMRKLTSTDYSYNSQLGFISINTSLQPDDVLAVAFEYTYLGQVYQVGEFTNNLPPGVDTSNVMFLKMLKSTSAQVNIPLWDLMMKNVYSLGAFQVSAEDFQLDILYQDPGGGFKRYIPANNSTVNGQPIITLLNLDRLNNNSDPFPDGVFDFVNGITINTTNGRIYFPVLEPFGGYLRTDNAFGTDPEVERFAYDELYNTTRVLAEQFPQYNRFVISGSYKSSVSSEIYLGAFNLPKGSVNVTAGGQQLTENIDYTIDYSLGRLKIVNESILNSGLPINVSFENNAFFGFQVKSLIGSRFDYWINDNFTMGATVMRLSERPFTQKVNFGDDPIQNTMLGYDINYSTDAPWLTRALDKLPFYDTKEMSTVSFTGEVARFLPGHSKAIGDGDEGVIYIDDFEGSRSAYDLKFPFSAWVIASTPQNAVDAAGNVLFPEATLFDSLEYGKNRAKIAWYSIDPLFLRDDNAARPEHLTEEDVSNHYLVEIQQQEIFPQADVAVTGLNNLSTFDLAYYPDERGPYNFDAQPTDVSAGIAANGRLNEPQSRWGGIMRSIETNDFEAANIEIIEFWVMDPFDNLGPFGEQVTDGGELYINVGNVSEDILKDSRTFFENGLAKDGSTDDLDATNWGLVPRTLPINNAFDNDPASRENQDKGYDGQNDGQESGFYADYLEQLQTILTPAALSEAQADPAADNYHYYRGGDYDNDELDVFNRYKRYNNPQGNSPTTESSPENYPTSATNLPESEDLNRDYTLNETEAYFQYRIPITPDMESTNPYITDVVVAEHTFENGIADSVKWYQFKVPLKPV